MTTRERCDLNKPGKLFARIAALTAAGLALSACEKPPQGDNFGIEPGTNVTETLSGSPETPVDGEKPAASPATPTIHPKPAVEDCLEDIWPTQPERDETFDRDHDQLNGQSISCDTGTTAGRFAATLDDIRDAASAKDADLILAQFDGRVLYIDEAGERVTLADETSRADIRDAMFDAEMLVLLSQIDLSKLELLPGEGAYYEFGTIWFASQQRGGYPRIITINRQAMREAAQSRR